MISVIFHFCYRCTSFFSLIAITQMILILNRNCKRTNSMPLDIQTDQPLWWQAVPAPTTANKAADDRFLSNFEIVRPRLLAIHSQIDLNLATLNSPSSSQVHSSSLPHDSPPSSFLLTFYTRDQNAYYAIIHPQETNISNDPQITELSNETCKFYQGHLVTPSNGYLAVTTCEGDSSSSHTMSASIMTSTGNVMLIRPTQSVTPIENIDVAVTDDDDRLRAAIQTNTILKNENLIRKDGQRDNCYMAEYEKRQVRIWEFAKNLNETSDKLESGTTESLQMDGIDQTHRLVYQFGPHMLLRWTDNGPIKNGDSQPWIGSTSTSGSNNNSKPCPQRYIDEEANIDDVGESDDESDGSELQSEHRIKQRDTSKYDIYSKIFTIETVIFVDASLIARFNGNQRDLQKLVLAIMNEVQLIYNFDSLKIRIRILIKQIIYLEGKDVPDTADGDIDQYLDNFCGWQKKMWQNANRTAKWDHALMLTGLDLYKKIGYKKNRKVLGLAWVNGMCRPAYSCTLNEGKNFEASFVIAHELAHSLGMLHDGYDNNCDPERYIMSEKTGPGKINWSPCSNLYLENFLTKSNMRCLESTRAEQMKRFADPFDHNRDTRLPGEQYTLYQQCQLALGTNYRAYNSNKSPFNDVCRELWCSSGTWATPAHPALEGSTCGRRKSCYQGTCVDKQQAFAKSKIKMYQNRATTEKPSKASNEGEDHRTSSSNSGSRPAPSFMRRVQRFLKTTINSVVRFFG